LARSATYSFAAFGLKVSGASAGINAKPDGRDAAIAAFIAEAKPLVEGGALTASAFLAADLVDRLLIYRAPILIGDGKPGLGPTTLGSLSDAHGRWRLADTRQLGSDTLQVYERAR